MMTTLWATDITNDMVAWISSRAPLSEGEVVAFVQAGATSRLVITNGRVIVIVDDGIDVSWFDEIVQIEIVKESDSGNANRLSVARIESSPLDVRLELSASDLLRFIEVLVEQVGPNVPVHSNVTVRRVKADPLIHLGTPALIFTTTPTIEGRRIGTYLGVVSGTAILGANVFKDFKSDLTNLVGGRSRTYEKVLANAQQAAFSEVSESALKVGATAIVAISVGYEPLDAHMLMATVTGTAVILV